MKKLTLSLLLLISVLGYSQSTILLKSIKGTAAQIPYGSSTGTLTSKSTFKFDAANNCLVIGSGTLAAGANEPATQTQKPIFELTNNPLDNGEQIQQFNMKTYGSSPGTSNDMHFYRYDGTEAAPTNTKLNMFLMSTGYRGYGTTLPTQSSVAFQVIASENWTDNAQGANVIFQTTPNGQNVPAGRRSAFMINNDQRIFLTKAYTTYSPYRSTGVLNIDLTNATSPSSTLSVGVLMTHSVSQSSSIIMGTSTTDEAYIFHYGSGVAGNYAGSSLPVASSFNFQSGASSNQLARIAGNAIAVVSGTTTTNVATRFDATGVRIGTVADVHTANVNTFQVAGSVAFGYVAKTASYTVTATDYLINCTANTFTVTLPTAVGITGRMYEVVNSGAGTITIATTSSQTFTNVTATPTTLTLAAAAAKSIKVMSNGANWIQLN